MNTIEKEILNLKSSLLKMFLLVEGQWEKGANAIINYDQDIAEEISSSENRINAQELKIDRFFHIKIAIFVIFWHLSSNKCCFRGTIYY